MESRSQAGVAQFLSRFLAIETERLQNRRVAHREENRMFR
jgi:hypothetical protein